MDSSVKISGMTCKGCVSSIETSLKKSPGVTGVKVNLQASNAVVTHDEKKISVDQICEKINDLGFDASI